ncbi:MAG: hypothetical protein R3257_02170, partial [bacterium]|nr:hypothetical protein [bacterium]
ESLTRLGESHEKAAALVQELAFSINPPGAMEALAQLLVKSLYLREQNFQMALQGKPEAYEAFSAAAPESRPVKKMLVELTQEVTTRRIFHELPEGKVYRLGDRRIEIQEAISRNVEYAYSALGKAAGRDQGVLNLLEGLTRRALARSKGILPAIQALAFAAGTNLRAVYRLQKFFQDQRKVSVGRAHWIRQQMADIPVHNLDAWDPSNALSIYPLRLLVEAGNPYAVTRLGKAALGNLRALEALDEASSRPEAWVGNAFRDIYVQDFALSTKKHPPESLHRQAMLLAIIAKKNNSAALEYLKDGLIQFEEPIYFAFDWLCRLKAPNIQRMLRETEIDNLIQGMEKSPSAKKAIDRLAELGNPAAQAFLRRENPVPQAAPMASPSRVISRQFPGTSHNYKLVLGDWSDIYPGFEADVWAGMGDEIVFAHRGGRPLRVQLRRFEVLKGEEDLARKGAWEFGVDLIEGGRRGHAVFHVWDDSISVDWLTLKDLETGTGVIFLDWISTQALIEGYRVHFTNIDNSQVFRILDRGKFLDVPRSWIEGYRPLESSEGELELIFQAPYQTHESVRRQHPEATVFAVRGKPNPQLIPDNFPK